MNHSPFQQIMSSDNVMTCYYTLNNIRFVIKVYRMNIINKFIYCKLFIVNDCNNFLEIYLEPPLHLIWSHLKCVNYTD